MSSCILPSPIFTALLKCMPLYSGTQRGLGGISIHATAKAGGRACQGGSKLAWYMFEQFRIKELVKPIFTCPVK
jgi:hypothetical protein